MKRLFNVVAILFLIMSCSTHGKYEKISGEWKCSSWTNKAKGVDKCRDNVYFNFRPDKTYYSELGSAKDSGDYKILEGKLYITPEGKMQFAVEITKLNNDTLRFLMNQAGDEEILTLVRKD